MNGPLVVLGDVMLDVDRVGRVERLSPEAPVPVITDVVDGHRPGGAALAAVLAARSAARPVVLVAPFAADTAGDRIRELLADAVRVVPLPRSGSTAVKTRVRAGGHPVARIDEGSAGGDIGALPDAVGDLLAGAGAILVADYGGGITSDPRIRAALREHVGRVPVVWDPHPRGAAPVPGVRLATPNLAELSAFAGRVGAGSGASVGSGTAAARAGSLGAVAAAAGALRKHWQIRSLCVTLGDRGAMLVEGDALPLLVPAETVAGGDTCGAGDMFAATAALHLAGGALPSEAAAAAVRSAGAFVAAGGAAGVEFHPAGPPRLDPAAPGQQAAHTSVDALLGTVRRNNGVVVATGGCFDLLHAGHVATLETARRLGNCLVVCLNGDASVRRLKGPGRPLQPAADRARVLAALEAVDAVVVFDEDTPRAVLRRLKPDIWVKGGDYTGLELPESSVLAEWGGTAVTVPYLAGRSTTALVEAAGGSAVLPVGAR